MVYKATHSLAPSHVVASRSLKSTWQSLFHVLQFRLNQEGDRAFAVAGPQLLNNLPSEVRNA